MDSSRKLSTRSAIFFTLTSMLGAGIFLKTQSLNLLSHGRISPIFVVFFIFLIGILAFAYVLVKIIPSQTGDMGFMEWSRNFCSHANHLAFCNFIRHIYYPVSIILFSVFGVLSFTGEQFTPFLTLLLALMLALALIWLNFISFEWAKKVHTLLSLLVLIPLVVLPIAALLRPGTGYSSGIPLISSKWSLPSGTDRARGFDSFGPWMILISGFPSLLFIYDGFYGVTSLKSRLQDPKKLGFVILTGMALVTGIYLWVIISFNIGDPVNANYRNFPIVARNGILFHLFEICISAASFLTLNSIIMGGIPQLHAIDKTHGFSDTKRIRKTIFYKNRVLDFDFEHRFAIVVALVAKVIIGFGLIWAILAIMLSVDLDHYSKDIFNSLADIVTVFVFIILLSVVIGSYRKGGDRLRKDKVFKRCVFISGATISLSVVYLFISYIVGTTGYGGSDIFSSWIKLLMLLFFAIGSFSRRIRDFICDKFGGCKYKGYFRHREGSLTVLH